MVWLTEFAKWVWTNHLSQVLQSTLLYSDSENETSITNLRLRNTRFNIIAGGKQKYCWVAKGEGGGYATGQTHSANDTLSNLVETAEAHDVMRPWPSRRTTAFSA